MDVSPQKQWHCDHCSSVFGRPDHLKRHALSHNPEKSHACHFCGAVFSRGDVLRRHWKSCKTRIGNGVDIPEGQRGGKHKRACDSCASIRKACNGEIPCAECSHRKRTCTYQRLDEDDDSSIHTGTDHDPTHVNKTQELDANDISDPTRRPDIPDDGSSWNLGPQNFYPDRDLSKVVYSRNRYGT